MLPRKCWGAVLSARYLDCSVLLLNVHYATSYPTGYDETEASKAESLLAYSLQLLLLTESTAGSSVCPVSLLESSDGDTWELDRSWPRVVLKHVLQAAGQTERLDELRVKVQGALGNVMLCSADDHVMHLHTHVASCLSLLRYSLSCTVSSVSHKHMTFINHFNNNRLLLVLMVRWGLCCSTEVCKRC